MKLMLLKISKNSSSGKIIPCLTPSETQNVKWKNLVLCCGHPPKNLKIPMPEDTVGMHGDPF